MPITYTVHDKEQFIHAIASGTVTDSDLIGYETAFANDERIAVGSNVLFEIKYDSFFTITDNGLLKAIEHKEKLGKKAKSYRCAIVTSGEDRKIWEKAQLYKKMNETKFPGVVTLVFIDLDVAKKWLDIEGN